MEDIRDKRDYFTIEWCIDDVMDADNGENDLTIEQARKILAYVEHHHDCNFGITWETFQFATTRVLEEEGRS